MFQVAELEKLPIALKMERLESRHTAQRGDGLGREVLEMHGKDPPETPSGQFGLPSADIWVIQEQYPIWFQEFFRFA